MAPERSAGSASAGSASGRLDRVLGVLRRVLPVLRSVRVVVTVLAVAAAGAVVAIWLAWATQRTPTEPLEWLLLTVICGVLAIPSILLLGARWMLTGIVELPERLKAEPELRRDQLQDLVALAQGSESSGRTAATTSAPSRPADAPVEAAPQVEPSPQGGPVRRAWGAGRILLGARSDLIAYGALLRVLSLSYLASAFASAGLAGIEVLVLYPVAFVIFILG